MSIRQAIDQVRTAAVFAALSAAAALLSYSLSGGGAWGGRTPDLTPIVALFFAFYRPRSLSPIVTFTVGVVADLLYGRMPGSGGIALLLAAEAGRFWSVRRHSVAPVIGFLATLPLALLHAFLLALLGLLAVRGGPTPGEAIWQGVASWLAYPFAYAVFRYVLRIRPDPDALAD